MSSGVIPDASTDFGARLRRRLSQDHLIWLVTIGAHDTPQPNPVWFLWQDEENLLIYNRVGAARLTHVRHHPTVAAHFNTDPQGGDVMVLTGRASLLADHPPADQLPAYLDKYAEMMRRVSGSVEEFARTYRHAMRVTVTRVRGF